jgi:hypothetical protein
MLYEYYYIRPMKSVVFDFLQTMFDHSSYSKNNYINSKINILWFKHLMIKNIKKINNICTNFLNKMNNQTWCLQVKMWHFSWDEGNNKLWYL